MAKNLAKNPAGDRPKIIATGDLIKESLADFRHNWQKFAYLLLIPLVISFLISLGSYVATYFFDQAVWPWPLTALAIVLFVGFIAVIAVLYVLTYISEFLLLKDLSQEVSFRNLREWYRRAKPYFWISIGISLSYTLLAMLGVIFLIIPGVIFSIFYCFAIYAVIYEGNKFEGAFGRSRELVRGYWWAVFGRFMAIGGLIYVLYLILGGLCGGFAWLIALALQLQSSKELFQLMYDLLSIFIGLAIGPLTMIYTYKIFQSLKETKNIQ